MHRFEDSPYNPVGSSSLSCFSTDVTAASFSTGEFVLGFDHGRVKYQHAVVMVQDLIRNDLSLTNSYLERYYTTNWHVYIGNSSNYSENEKCPGGPHLTSYQDYTEEADNFTFLFPHQLGSRIWLRSLLQHGGLINLSCGYRLAN